MPSTYVTRRGEALDMICQREYGAQAGVAEQVLEANPHIKESAHRLPAGIELTLPDLNLQERTGPQLRLWD